MKKELFGALLAMPLFFAACDKDNSDDNQNTVSYQPTTTGSTWQYESENKLTSTETEYTLTATDKDTSVGGKSYNVFTNSGGANEYYYSSGNDYYQFGGIAGITGNTELLYLKATGSAWDETKTVNIPGLGDASVKLNYTLVETIPSMTVAGTAYTNVLHVKVELSNISVSGLPITVASQDLHFYYAPNVGRIKSQIKLTLTPPLGGPITVDQETNLKSATIK